jgi:hypothetical protein
VVGLVEFLRLAGTCVMRDSYRDTLRMGVSRGMRVSSMLSTSMMVSQLWWCLDPQRMERRGEAW